MNRFAIMMLGTLSVSIYAAEEEKDPFKAELELGAIVTSGNTETTSLKGKATVRQDITKWRNTYVLEGLYKKDQLELENTETDDPDDTYKIESTTAHKFFASAQFDYKLNEDYQALFVFGSHEDDRFSGYQYQRTLAAGYSDRLFETENSHFDYSVGPGVAFSAAEIDDPETTDTDETEETSTMVVRAAIEYVYRISENAKFSQAIATDYAVDDNDNSRTRSETSVSANINSSLAMKASYLINYNSRVQGDNVHADTQAAVTLVFSF